MQSLMGNDGLLMIQPTESQVYLQSNKQMTRGFGLAQEMESSSVIKILTVSKTDIKDNFLGDI